MKFAEKYDTVLAGIISGLVLPFIVGTIIYFSSSNHLSLHSYLLKIWETRIVTHAISLCVFPNILIFLIYNRLDMLKAARGVLGVTIGWAVMVFVIRFLG